MASLILRPLLLLLSLVYFAEFLVEVERFQTSGSPAGGVVLKIKMSKTLRRTAAVRQDPTHGGHFITSLFTGAF